METQNKMKAIAFYALPKLISLPHLSLSDCTMSLPILIRLIARMLWEERGDVIDNQGGSDFHALHLTNPRTGYYQKFSTSYAILL